MANLRCRSISEIVLTDAEFFAARATHPVVWRVRLDGSRSCRHVNCLEPLTAVEHEVEFLFPCACDHRVTTVQPPYSCLEPLTAVEHEAEFLFPPCV